jgi:O-antigen ligase
MARERLTSIFKLSTYRDEKSSARWRLQIWQWTADVIKHYPVLGLGAGWEVYENYVKTHYDVKPGIETPQAHNNFLEVAAESGLGAAALFAAFTAALVVQISRAWRGTQRQTKRRFVVAGFFALLIAITVHGMSSYSLRYTIGMLVWICFALLTLLPMIARAIPEEAAQAPPSA